MKGQEYEPTGMGIARGLAEEEARKEKTPAKKGVKCPNHPTRTLVFDGTFYVCPAGDKFAPEEVEEGFKGFQKAAKPPNLESFKFDQPLTVYKLKGRIFEFALVEIIGAIIMTNFYDNFWYTGVAFLLWGIYIILPDQYDVLNRAVKNFESRAGPGANYASFQFQDELRSQAWPLWIRVFFKLMMVMLIAVQFSIFSATLPMANFITLMVLFLLYFTMPTVYAPDQPWKAVEAWFRFVLGITIAAFMWALFTGRTAQVLDPLSIAMLQLPIVTLAMADAMLAIFTALGGAPSVNLFGVQLAGSPAALFFLLGLAFFATLPVELEVA